MRNLISSTLAAVTFAGAITATATPAFADSYHHRRHKNNNDDVAAAAIFAGVAGLAIGAAIADKGNDHSRSRYDDAYRYSNGYGYDPRSDRYYGGYHHRPGHHDRTRVCTVTERDWDPYLGRYVKTKRRYPC